MGIVLIFWLLCGVVCYFIMKSKGYPNNTCLAHGVGGALLGIIWIIVVLCKSNCDDATSSSKLSDMELLSKMMDLKERGAITEAEFEQKKREILSNVKKNNKSVNQLHTLRTLTVLSFFADFIICGIGWVLYETHLTGNTGAIGYDGFLNWITDSFASMAIICTIMTLMLFMKADVRFLCIPIIMEGIGWFWSFCDIITRLSDFKNFNFLTYICIICTISIILMLALIFLPNKGGKNQQPIILYVIPGICRVMHSIFWFMLANSSPLHVDEGYFIDPDPFFSWLLFLGFYWVWSIAYTLLGATIKQLTIKRG